MKGPILVVNAGSSSLKLRVLDDADKVVGSRDLPAVRGLADEVATAQALGELVPVAAVGHRIVHGGDEFFEPVLVTPEVVRKLQALTDLAPLHQPKSLAALEVVTRVLGDVPAVACFDTAFHATMPAVASTYALPPEWRRRWHLRKYGFHGLSHAYAARRAAQLLGRPSQGLRLVTCHLGAGASLAAVRDGRSIDTSMGFTPLDGLVMATRSGSVDPGLLLWIEEHAGTPPAELAATLEHRSGLLGLAGTADMREVLAREATGDPVARLALGVYLYRLRMEIAGMVAALEGLDALVFTGGVGEHAAEVRRRACEGLAFLGVAVDAQRNSGGPSQVTDSGESQRREERPLDREIGTDDARVRTFVIEAREDLEITHQVRLVLKDGAIPASTV
ncbi:MAG: acetate/propionate family kinase [Thermoleophilia bacterium]